MNIKAKRFLFGLGLNGAIAIFLLFYFDQDIIYLFPKTAHSLHLIEHIIILSAICCLVYALVPLVNAYLRHWYESYLFRKKEGDVCVATNLKGKKIYLSHAERRQHLHVIGTTGVGKTEFLLNMMFQDIEQGRGLLLIEHKSDHGLLDRIYAKVKEAGRERDFHLFSLIHLEKSSTYNPLIGGDAHEIADRVFRSFDITHEFYKNVQFQWLSQVIMLLTELGEPITFIKLFEYLCDDEKLDRDLDRYERKDAPLWKSIKKSLGEAKSYRNENLKGLEVLLAGFATGKLAQHMNVLAPEISMEETLEKNKIIYFQLPTMKYYQMAIALGKMVLQDFQSAVSTRQTMNRAGDFFSCYLDEFSSLAYPSFTELISKARSANVGLVLSHQSLGDLTKVSEGFADAVLTNCNNKIVFRCPDPKTAEYFGKALGTVTTTYRTEQTQVQMVGDSKTGIGTLRDVEQFIVHPDEMKKFSVGHGVISIVSPYGVKIMKCYFPKVSSLSSHPIPMKKYNFLEVKSESGKQQERINLQEMSITKPKNKD